MSVINYPVANKTTVEDQILALNNNLSTTNNNLNNLQSNIAPDILNSINTHNQSIETHQDIRTDIRNVEAIARGKATSHTFNTKSDMDEWLLIPENLEKLVVGDNLYIRALLEYDYWWDGTSPQILEAEVPNLTDYPTRSEVAMTVPITIEQTQYDSLVSAGTVHTGRIYYVVPDGTLAGV